MNETFKENNKQYGSDCIGNVIRILDNRTLIVNVGKSILDINSKIHVYTIEKILHDVDGSTLCPLEYIKDTLEVIQTESEYSICQKQECKHTHFASLSPLFDNIEYIPLNVYEEDIEPLTPPNANIKIGDPIKRA